MRIGVKLTGAFVLVAALGAVVGVVALVVNSHNAAMGEKSIKLAEQSKEMSRQNQALAEYNAELNARAALYGTFRKALMDSIVTDDRTGPADTDSADTVPLFQWVQSVQTLFVYNEKELILPPEKLGLLLYAGDAATLETAIQANEEEDEEESDEDGGGGLGLMGDLMGGGVEDKEKDETSTGSADDKTEELAETDIRFVDFLARETLAEARQALESARSESGRTTYAQQTASYETTEAAIAGKLAAVREPYIALRKHALDIKSKWRQRHIQKETWGSYDLIDEVRNTRDTHNLWVAKLRKAMLFGEPITDETLELELEQTAIGSWTRSNICRSFRERWPLFDSVIGKILGLQKELHGVIDEMRGIESAEQRLAMYQKRAYPLIEKIDAQFFEVWKAEYQLIMMQTKAKQTLENDFLPALAEVQAGVNEAIDALAGAEDAIRSEQAVRRREQEAREQERLVQEDAQRGAVLSNLQEIRKATLIILGCTIGAVVLAVLMGVVISHKISRNVNRARALAQTVRQGDLDERLPDLGSDEIGELAESLNAMADGLQEKVDVAESIAEGDLTREVDLASDRDAFGRALTEMLGSLNSIVHSVEATAAEVSHGADGLKDSSQALSASATEQAASLEEITSTMTELASQVHTNAEDAGNAGSLAGTMRGSAETGVQQVKRSVEAMQDLESTGQSISAITETIDNFASQTALLALNAVIEAARAGRHGKGFSVVANEMKNLADRIGKESKSIAALMEAAVEKIHANTELAQETAAGFEEIMENLIRVTDLVQGIAEASRQQSAGIDQVQAGLGQIDASTQQNAANAEETAATAEQLSAQVAHLRDLLTRFTLKQHTVTAPGESVSVPVEASPFKTEDPPALAYDRPPAGYLTA